jgi:NAD(P)-dependent dehydrogenase (short-subunit alcohol dehydrogenase family)
VTASATPSTALADLVRLDGRVAVVTGAGAGIGRATASRLAEAGATVVASDLDAARLEAVAGDIANAGGTVDTLALDVRDTAAIERAAAEVASRHGRLDAWVNNAGIYPPVPITDLDEAAWDAMLEINLRSVFFAGRAAARHMAEAGHGGVVLNIASIAAYRAGPPDLAHYAASKAGVVSLTKNLAWAFGAAGVRVVGIAPGVIETDGLKVTVGRLAEIGANVGNRGSRIAVGRLGTPDDIARVALFLVSDLASFVTGVTIAVDGGDVVIGPSERPSIYAPAAG